MRVTRLTGADDARSTAAKDPARDPNAAPGRVVIIGNLDGVHRGHKAIVLAAVALAKERGLEPSVLTFDPHPSAVVGAAPPPLLTTLDRKAELIARLGVERLFARTFDAEFAAWTPDQFVRDLVVAQLGAKAVFVGDNFRFGGKRRGGVEALRAMGASGVGGDGGGFDVVAFPMLVDAKGPLSSSRVRADVAAGEIEDAELTLGRWHALKGIVVHGDARGRTIGFPTANLAEVRELLPPHGVYAVAVDLVGEEEGGAERALGFGVMNVGVRPTVGGDPRRSIEVHLLDVARDLYGAYLRVHLVARLRSERKFDGLDALKAQIGRDVAEARARLRPIAIPSDAPFG